MLQHFSCLAIFLYIHDLGLTCKAKPSETKFKAHKIFCLCLFIFCVYLKNAKTNVYTGKLYPYTLIKMKIFRKRLGKVKILSFLNAFKF